jgi:hypothetical protein
MLNAAQIEDIAVWLENHDEFEPLAETALRNAAEHVIELLVEGINPLTNGTFQVLMIGAILVQAGFEAEARAQAQAEADKLERQLLEQLVATLVGQDSV